MSSQPTIKPLQVPLSLPLDIIYAYTNKTSQDYGQYLATLYTNIKNNNANTLVCDLNQLVYNITSKSHVNNYRKVAALFVDVISKNTVLQLQFTKNR